MEDAIKDIAPAAIAETIPSETVVEPEPAPTPAPTLAPTPEALAEAPKAKPGRPRKVATATTTVAPVKAAKARKAPKADTKAEIIAEKAVVEVLPVLAAKPARSTARKSVVTTPAKVTPGKVAAKATAAVIKTRKTPIAASKSAAPKQKDIFVMNASTTEMTETMQTAMKDAAEKAKAALAKSQAALGDMSSFTKGNMEAVVESSKILATGLQEMSKSYVAESKSVVETMTAEIKDLASVKSPTEFFEKQSAMMRKQFDAAMAVSSKNSEAMLKLASEAFQPISNRVSIAVEKMKQAA